jgi:antitoxin component YwqK of YwqJK toxin-antitoxin module
LDGYARISQSKRSQAKHTPGIGTGGEMYKLESEYGFSGGMILNQYEFAWELEDGNIKFYYPNGKITWIRHIQHKNLLKKIIDLAFEYNKSANQEAK